MKGKTLSGASIAVVFLAASGASHAGVSSDVLNLTGGRRTRLVWSRDTAYPYNHTFGGHSVYKLVGFDTSEGSERVILGTVSDYSHPRLSHDGGLVVYTNYATNGIYAVNWDGTNHRKIVSNARHGCLWYDESAGKEFVVYQSPVGRENPLYLADVNNPGDTRLLYSSRYCTIDWLSISRDGTRLGGSFPWDSCGVVTLSGPGYVEFDRGCWASITPDSVYRFATFDGAHRNWKVRDADGSNYRLVSLNGGPGVDGWEIYHPRFAANDAGFCTVNGPYSVGPMGGNNIGAGGSQVELYLGRFDANVTQVNGWAKVTYNGEADFFGHAWVEPSSPTVRIDSFIASPATVAQGSSSTLSWATSNATSVSINGGIGTVAADGSMSVSPSGTVTYTLTAQGPGGPVTREVTVAVESLRSPENPSGTSAGLEVRYYELSSQGALPDFGGLAHYASDVVARIDYPSTTGDFATSGRSENVGAVFTGYVSVPADGVYTFYTESDDGSALYIGGTMVVENDGLHGMQERSGTIGLMAGKHALRVEFFEASGGAGLVVRYGGPGASKQTIPPDALFHVPSAPPGPVHLKVNCGGNSCDVPGWERDDAYVSGGSDFTFEGAFDTSGAAAAAPAGVYRSVRHLDHSYSFPVPDGTYVVRLHLGDAYGGGRAMDYTAEGVKVVNDLDVAAEAGGTYKALVLEFAVSVFDGNGLQIQCEKDGGNDVFEGGVEIIAAAQDDPSGPSITIITPHGGEAWHAGSTQHIQWTTGNLEDVSIFYSTDGGQTAKMIAQTVFVDDPEWGSYPWVVPDEPSTECLIRVQGYFGEVPTWSAGAFEIRAAGPTSFHGLEGGCGGGAAAAFLAVLAILALRRGK